MNIQEIGKIIEMFEKSSLGSLEVEENGLRVRLDKTSNATFSNNVATSSNTKSEAKENTEPSGNKIKSPLVGTYHEGQYQGAEPFVRVGDKVKKGDKLCIIEAMKTMNEITSPYDGVVEKICFKDNDMVMFDATLFIIGD